MKRTLSFIVIMIYFSSKEHRTLQKSIEAFLCNCFIPLIGIPKIFLIVIIIFFNLISHAEDYYISPTGDNGNSGLIGNPWQTLSYACRKATTPGDNIYLLKGTYIETNYARVEVGVDLCGLDSATVIVDYSRYSSAPYEACVRLYAAAEGENGNQTISGITFYGGLVAQSCLRVRGRSNVVIHNCAFINFVQRGAWYQARTDDLGGQPTIYATGNVFRNNTITNSCIYTTTATGGFTMGGQVGMLVHDNIITATGRTAGSNGYPIKYHDSGYNKGVKIYNNTLINSMTSPFDFAIEMFNVSGMEVYNNDIIGSVDFNHTTKDTFSYGLYVHDNNIGASDYPVSGVDGACVRLEFEAENVIIDKNYFQYSPKVIHFANRDNYDYNNIQITRNVANHVGSGLTNAGKFIVFTNDAQNNFDIDGLYIMNNTILGSIESAQLYGVVIPNVNSVSNIKIQNNIITNFSLNNVLIQGDVDKLDFTNNLTYNCGNSNQIAIKGRITNYSEKNNILNKNPLFENVTNLVLKENSPAIDAGIDVGLKSDLKGNPIIGVPDIGAFESEDLSDTIPPIIFAFKTPDVSTSMNIDIYTYDASDNIGIIGYLLTETSATPSSEAPDWSTSKPTSFTFASEGIKTLYAWAKDAAGNVSSSASAQVVITLPEVSPTVSEYLFEESSSKIVKDSKGIVDGIIINEELRREGANGKGLEFTGSGYISLGHSFGENVQNEVTLSAWIKPTSVGGNWQGIIMHGGPNIDSYALYINPTTKSIGFKTSGTSSSWLASDNVNELWDGNWHQIVATYNGAEKIIYLNNIILTKISAEGKIESGVGYNLLIGAGRDEATPTLLYQGLIDEVRIYNYSLSKSEIKNLFDTINTMSDTIYSEETISICEGTSYNGWKTEGEYQRTLMASTGADSIVTTYLTVNSIYNITEEINIKEGENYMGWTESGDYQRNLTSIYGCDSIVTTHLSVAKTISVTNPVTTYEDISICEGNSYNGWTDEGEYVRTLHASNGTDSIVTTVLTVNPTYLVSEDITIKEGEDYFGWTEAGEYQRNLTSISGCDSIITTNLTVLRKVISFENVDLCEGDSYEGWTTTGQYERTFPAQSGADSIVHTNLWVHRIYDIKEDIVIYEGETYLGWDKSGTYQRNLLTIYGCDSTVTTNLEVIQAIIIYEDVEICDGSSYLGWTTSGQYQRILKAKSGGDSIVITNLWVNPTYDVTEEIFINEGENYMGWTQSGEYQRYLTSIYGCDSMVTTILNVVANTNDPNNLTNNEITQIISLKKGWNIFSSNVIPENADMDVILGQLAEQGDLVLVQDENGNTYEHLKSSTGWDNNIGELKITEGYEIQVNSNCVLTIIGKPMDTSIDINLKKGWNIISYPYKGTVDAMQIFQPLINSGTLDKVLDEKGNSIEYWRNRGWINKIGNLEQGEGYKVLVNADEVIHMNHLNQKTSIITFEKIKTEHFNAEFIENGFCHMNFNLLGLNETNLNTGDEIAIFDGTVCVGAYKISNADFINNALSIPTSASDYNMINGFYEGNTVSMKYWNSISEMEYEMSPYVVEGALSFQKLSSVFIVLDDQTTSASDFFDTINPEVYPNPASTSFSVRFSRMPESDTELMLLDITGNEIEKRKVMSTYEVFDVHSLPSGLYFLKTFTGNNCETKKVIIN